MFPTYRITVQQHEDNRYGVGRTETWIVRKGPSFATAAERNDYIIDMTIAHVPEYSNLSIDVKKEEDKLFFEREFCFTNPLYLKYRRFFAFPPPMEEIKKILDKEGISTS